MKFNRLIILLLISSLFVSCFEDLDDKINPASTLDIQDFIYRGLNYFYLYKATSPKLANDAFADAAQKNIFLQSFATPEELFDYLIVSQDRFSRLFPDYNVIENALSGVTLNTGMQYGLVYYPDGSKNVFGYVRYVVPNSDAQDKGLRRGDIFTSIDGVQLNDQNYSSLLAPNTFTVDLATYDGTNFHYTGNSVELVKSQIDENPVLLAETIEHEGRKIGYLMYNSFVQKYDTQLNDAFGKFKAEGVSDVVIDLRYNGGGSVATATDLASMITGQFTGQVFYHEFWNADRQPAYGKDGLFDTKISNGATINSLNMVNVYFLTTGNTASASELVINGLDPYINTVQIGTNTTGKFQASFLMYDAPAPNFSKSQANPSHTYVMLPLVFKTANKDGKTDFVEGLTPDIELRENYFNLGTLGSTDEPLLAEALSLITGAPKASMKSSFDFKELTHAEMGNPLHGIMVVNQE